MGEFSALHIIIALVLLVPVFLVGRVLWHLGSRLKK